MPRLCEDHGDYTGFKSILIESNLNMPRLCEDHGDYTGFKS